MSSAEYPASTSLGSQEPSMVNSGPQASFPSCADSASSPSADAALPTAGDGDRAPVAAVASEWERPGRRPADSVMPVRGPREPNGSLGGGASNSSPSSSSSPTTPGPLPLRRPVALELDSADDTDGAAPGLTVPHDARPRTAGVGAIDSAFGNGPRPGTGNGAHDRHRPAIAPASAAAGAVAGAEPGVASPTRQSDVETGAPPAARADDMAFDADGADDSDSDGADDREGERDDTEAMSVEAETSCATGAGPAHLTRWARFEAWLERLATRSTLVRKLTSRIYLPLAFHSGLTMKKLDAATFTCVLPFRRFNRNWYNAMAGAALLANSEIAAGMYLFGELGGQWTIVCKNLSYRFLRPCFGPAIYRVTPRQDLLDLMHQGREFNIDLDLEVLQHVKRRGRERRVGRSAVTFHCAPKAAEGNRAMEKRIKRRNRR